MNDLKLLKKYLGIANHDIQTAGNLEELKSYVASILFEQDKLQSNWNSLREWIKENSWYYNTSDGCQWVDQFKLLDKMNELEGVDNN